MGWIEVRPDERPGDRPGFAGSSTIIGTEELYEELRENPRSFVNARALLRARSSTSSPIIRTSSISPGQASAWTGRCLRHWIVARSLKSRRMSRRVSTTAYSCMQ